MTRDYSHRLGKKKVKFVRKDGTPVLSLIHIYLMELVVIELEGFALKRVLTPENVKKLFPVSEEPS